MIVLDVEQGSPEWIAARCGIPTASNFHRIITQKTLKYSAASRAYMHELVAERLLGASVDPYVSELMERGIELESAAVDFYEMQRDCETIKVGHILTDDGRSGCSPDRLVGVDGGLEIKCPSPAVHVSYLLGAKEKYRAQVQGALWITGRKWWDFLSFSPELPPALVRFDRDETYIAALSKAVKHFCAEMDLALEHLRDKGITVDRG